MDSTTTTLLIGSGTAIIVLALKLCYNSRCSRFACCGITIIRDVSGEIQIPIGGTPAIQQI